MPRRSNATVLPDPGTRRPSAIGSRVWPPIGWPGPFHPTDRTALGQTGCMAVLAPTIVVETSRQIYGLAIAERSRSMRNRRGRFVHRLRKGTREGFHPGGRCRGGAGVGGGRGELAAVARAAAQR